MPATKKHVLVDVLTGKKVPVTNKRHLEVWGLPYAYTVRVKNGVTYKRCPACNKVTGNYKQHVLREGAREMREAN